ncbi:PA3371 family protein [Pseudomonas sp. NPDC007930]|uniref:PA3371 family protein n=1 Tax=Pseudomonas sp. NPDC007930 TaxID=3364417 RepID=UPI0036EF0232
MSRSAVVFLIASALSLLGALLASPGTTSDGRVLLFAGSCFAVLFILALIRGKRFRFDPQLR